MVASCLVDEGIGLVAYGSRETCGGGDSYCDEERLGVESEGKSRVDDDVAHQYGGCGVGEDLGEECCSEESADEEQNSWGDVC